LTNIAKLFYMIRGTEEIGKTEEIKEIEETEQN
jgi:hypothetical protein